MWRREGPQPRRDPGGDKVERDLLRQQRDGKVERKKEINSLLLFLSTDSLEPGNKEKWSGRGQGEDETPKVRENRGREMPAEAVRQGPHLSTV